MLDEADTRTRLGLGNCEGLRAVLADDARYGLAKAAQDWSRTDEAGDDQC